MFFFEKFLFFHFIFQIFEQSLLATVGKAQGIDVTQIGGRGLTIIKIGATHDYLFIYQLNYAMWESNNCLIT